MNLPQIKSDALAGTPADPPTTIALVEEVERLREALKIAANALAKSYDVTEWPADGTSSQDAALTYARQALGEDNES